MSAPTQESRPSSQASMSAVSPLQFGSSTSAPLAMSARTWFRSPAALAPPSGVTLGRDSSYMRTPPHSSSSFELMSTW